jgi:hypothetical protein
LADQLKVSLLGIEPEIWRSFKVPSDFTFHDLHQVIQVVMGWDNYHLFEFTSKGKRIGLDMEDDFLMSDRITPSDSITIQEVLPRKRSNVGYTYDFGDSWEHSVVVEGISKDEVLLHPICLDGAMNCPPEDCNGVWGYVDLLEIIQNKNHPEHKEMLEWIGGKFDPSGFDIQLVKKQQAKFKR